MVNRKNVSLMCGLRAEVNCALSPFQWDWSRIRDHEARLLLVTERSYPIFGRFDRYEVDLNRGELRKEGASLAIQEQPFQILRMLLQAEGEVVTREQLCSALWPKDTFVDFEHGINTAVKKLRQALEDSAERPRFIETLPRIGYRFIAPVEWTLSRHNASPRPNVVPIATPEPGDTSQEVLRERIRRKTAVAVFVS